MKSEVKIHKLSYMLITQAVAGDENALSEILSIYEPYHNALVTYEVVGENGMIYQVIDEENFRYFQSNSHYFILEKM